MRKYETALACHNMSLWAHEKLNDKIGMARDYTNIAMVLNSMGNHQEALDFNRKSLTIFEELTDKVGMAQRYRSLGDIYYSIGNFKEAIESFSKSLTILQDFEEKTGYHDPSIEILQNNLVMAVIAAESENATNQIDEFKSP